MDMRYSCQILNAFLSTGEFPLPLLYNVCEHEGISILSLATVYAATMKNWHLSDLIGWRVLLSLLR